jgi:hypothetical protein
MLKAAEIVVTPGEPRGVFRWEDGTYSHGGCDLEFFEEGPLGRRTFGDVSRINESSPRSVRELRTDVKAGTAAEKRAQEKRGKFAEPCRLIDTTFIPLTLEIGGHMGRDFVVLIRRWGSR